MILVKKYFQYIDQLLDYVNNNKIDVISITNVGKYTGEGFYVFYYEKDGKVGNK